MPFVPAPQEVDGDLAFKGVLSPELDSPLPVEVDVQEDSLTSSADVTTTLWRNHDPMTKPRPNDTYVLESGKTLFVLESCDH